MLVDTGNSLPSSKAGQVLNDILKSLSSSTRETDVTGWYTENSVLGVMFTDIDSEDENTIITTVLERVSATLRNNLSPRQFSQVSISFHFYPEEWEHELFRRPCNPVLYPDFSQHENSRRFASRLKRAMDLIGSIIALILFAPLFALIAVAIKATSKGPVLFRQERIGQHGRPFVFLKFRSMYADNDARVHQEWFKEFLSGEARRHPTNNGNGSYKLTEDPRITRVGKILRRTSLDELPQFICVLKGEMSLVGPRPPIPYEVDAYETWHRGRVLQAKPGLTGLWQVNGRSRVTFDDMVRLDLQYARTWSIWLDLKILLQTPRAVLLGDGAY